MIKCTSIALLVLLSATLAAADEVYNEVYRPQFHFSPKKNWTNDPNGLVYYKGTWHLFFQHNPKGIEWGNMTWGHATSPDLVHWTELGLAIEPDELGTIFSGSAVVDWNNTSGLQTARADAARADAGDEKVLCAFYTAAGKPFTQCMAYSNDAGKTWVKYERNPIIPNIAGDNRDPKVIWHEPSKKWVMALYLVDNDFAILGSTNLKEWNLLQRFTIPGSSECPDFFSMTVLGKSDETKWVFAPADGNYLIGSFDGTAFTPEQDKQEADWGKNFYACQTYSDAPGGRRIQIAWMKGGKYPGMPFNQQMSFPCELTLQSFPEGLRICRNPVKEIELLRERTQEWAGLKLQPGDQPSAEISGELFDIRADLAFDPENAPLDFGFVLRGEPVKYDPAKKEISCLGATAPMDSAEGKVQLQLLLDRTTIEAFGNGGKISMSSCFLPDPKNKSVRIYTNGAPITITKLEVHHLKSTWRKDSP